MEERQKDALVTGLLLRSAGAKKLYRGDSRTPETLAVTGSGDAPGFSPQGTDASLYNHLSFRGNSAFVAATLDKEVALRYAFGRTGEKAQTGYVYKIKPTRISAPMYDVKTFYPTDRAAQINQEISILGEIPLFAVKGWYQVKTGEGGKIRWGKYTKNPEYKKGWPPPLQSSNS